MTIGYIRSLAISEDIDGNFADVSFRYIQKFTYMLVVLYLQKF